MANLTPEQIEHYYRTRLDGFRIRHSKGTEWRSQCPFHGGENVSVLSVDCHDGKFHCFACGAGGKTAFSFEMSMQKVETGSVPEHGIVQAALAAILGVPITERRHELITGTAKGRGWDRNRAQARYVYTDELGEEQFSVWRFVDSAGRKATPPDMPCRCSQDAECPNGCESGRYWGSKGARRVLYRLPDVIQSSIVFVVEGEKNVDHLSKELAGYIRNKRGFQFGRLTVDRVGVTTNPGGATAWKAEYGYGKFFQGKVVVKLGDNDGPGRKHDHDACSDIARFAHSLYTLSLPVGEGEDISDLLNASGLQSFLKLLPCVVPWQVPKPQASIVADELAPRTLLVKPSQLVRGDAVAGGDWLVQGLIERGTRGLVVAPPKTGKSLLFLELALCLATEKSFLGAKPYPVPVKCGIISREDGPTLVHRRLMQLAAGKGLSAADVDRNIVVNTEAQSSRFKIDRRPDLEEMADWLRMEGVEFAVIDVLNRLHDQEENSSGDMTRVMQHFDELAQRSACQVCVIHHTNKGGGVKGSTSIEGWADYVVRLEQSTDDDALKSFFLKTKSSGAVVPRSVRYYESDDRQISRITPVVQRTN